MLFHGVVVCLFFTGVISVSDSDSLELVNLKLKPRRKVKQFRPHWISKPEGGSFRATTFSDDGSYSGRNQYSPQSYAGYGGSPPWNYGNQQQPDKDNSLKERPGYYPQSGQQGNYPGKFPKKTMSMLLFFIGSF